MSTPVLHVLAGPNGSGKSTFAHEVLQPVTGLPFVNADEIAARRWPGHEQEHAYDASRTAADERERALANRRSFITETVFSHPSKHALVHRASAAGYLVALHVMLVPVELSVARVRHRVEHGGHRVPEGKIRARYERLWALVLASVEIADGATFYDNTRASEPFRTVARFERGQPAGPTTWPAWTPFPTAGRT